MKLTWFAHTAIRVHVGGQILVADPDEAPASVEREELLSGADRVFSLATHTNALPLIDPAVWRRRTPVRAIDETPAETEILVSSIGPFAVLVDAPGEPPLALLAGSSPPAFGRWADDGVVVLFGVREALVATATVLLDLARPRLIALASDEETVDLAIDELREHLDGASLVSLEPGLALEV